MKKHYVQLTKGIRLLLTAACLLLSQTTWAQSVPDAQWARVGNTLGITTDGNIISSTNSNSGQGATVTKYDLQGNIIWSRGSLAGASYLAGKLPIPGTCPCVNGYAIITDISAITPTPDGGVALSAREFGGRGIITSLNAAGQQRGSDYSGGYNQIVTPDGGSLYLNSFTEDVGLGRSRIGVSVTKTGNPSWTTKFSDGSNDDSVTDANLVFNTPDGGYLLAGYQLIRSYGSRHSWVAKLDGQGKVSWQTWISLLPPGPNGVSEIITITDVIVSADGSGYTLVGPRTAYPGTNSTILVEIDLNGKVKQDRAKVIDPLQATNAYITKYTGSNGKTYYAVGNTSLQDRPDPQILLVDPSTLTTVAKRIFPGPGASSIIDIDRAGDGSLVFVTDNKQLVKLSPESTPPTPPTGSSLSLLAPTYDCATGAITFNTSGGNGSTIEYQAAGITGWTTNPNQFVDKDSRTASDVKPFTLMARQSGVVITYVWDLRAYCNGNPNPPVNPPTPPTPPVTPPTGGSLALLAPTYNCATGAITFNTSGGNGSTIEYSAAGITSWTTNPNQFVDKDSRTASDVKPFTLMARQNGVVVTYVWDLRAYCSGTPTPPTPPTPPVTPPTGGSLALIAPTYNCTTGAITFNTSGGNGSTIEYQAAGITGWTTNPNQFVDKESRTASDVKPFTLMARQSGVVVTYVWDLKATCGRARTAALPEPGTGLQVRVLGNPILNQMAEVEITGAERQALHLNLIDLQGRVLHQQRIEQPEATQRVRVPMGEQTGLFFLNVSIPSQHQQVKLVKP